MTILPEDRQLETLPGVTLRFLLLKNDYELPFPCGGEGICGRCRVFFSKNPPSPNIYDRRMLSQEELERGVRLACKAVIEGDCEVVLPSVGDGLSLVSKGDLLIPLEELVDTVSPDVPSHVVGVDLGTTTLFVSLVDVVSRKRIGWRKVTNPQSPWGGDLMSRIKAASDSETAAEMRRVTLRAIEEQVEALLSQKGLSPQGLGYALAGNAPMEELFFSETLAPFGRHPFQGRLSDSERVEGPFGQPMTLLPVAGGMVGGDALSLLEVARIKGLSLPLLGMDLGTNAEIFLWTEEGVWAASAPAGPAFEGMGMRHGVGWTKGAVYSVEKRGPHLKVEVIGQGEPSGFCGSGILSFLALLVEQWIVGRDGRIREPSRLPSPWDNAVSEEDGQRVVYLPGTGLSISQDEIRQVQMAVAAVSAAVKVLLKRAHCALEDIATLAVAGGFGSSLNPQWLKVLGVPVPPFAQTVVLGNAALCGAELWQVNSTTPLEMGRMARDVRVLNLAEEEGFEELYIDSMHFGG